MLMKNISNCAAGIKGGYPFITRQAFKISSTTIHPPARTISGIKLKPRPLLCRCGPESPGRRKGGSEWETSFNI